jgi:hypothetical protein
MDIVDVRDEVTSWTRSFMDEVDIVDRYVHSAHPVH